MPTELLKQMKGDLKLRSVMVGYGMTETSMCHSITTVFDEQTSYKHAYESCGI